MKFKVITINLWHGGRLMDKLLEFLRQENADFVLLQEAYNGTEPMLEPRFRSMQYLSEELGYPHQDFVPTYLEQDNPAAKGICQQGNGILSKFQITARGHSYLDSEYSETYLDSADDYTKCPRVLQHIEIDAEGQKLNLFNVHGPWGIPGEAYTEPRKVMEQTILNQINSRTNVILAGDTNAKTNNQAVISLASQLSDVFDGQLATTFNMQRKTNPGYATAPVDIIFISKQLKTINATCPLVDISDHLPLVARLELT